MTKSDLVEFVAKSAGLSKADAMRACDAIFNPTSGAIARTLKKGETVTLTGFGRFDVRKRAARTGRNPATSAEIKIPASKAPGFKAGATLRETVGGRKKR